MVIRPPEPLNRFRAADGELEVVEVSSEDGATNRMRELGICPGKRVAVVRAGNPAILAVSGSRFALSRELMVRVLVRPVA